MRVSTPNSAFNQNASTDRYTSYGDYSITTTEANKIKKVAGTKADTSATFYFIDLDGQIIYSIGYGADIDRTIPYKDANVYSVTYTLSNVTSSNNISGIVEGQSFTTTLTLGASYTWDSVKITMGGTDITSSAYSNGVVTISNVTGNIVITASAKDNYVPHWDIADRTAVTNVNEGKTVAHACVTSRHNYIYGIASTGLIDYRQISNVSVSGNDVTFGTVSYNNYNIGLPYQLDAGAGYKFSATASQSARLRVATFDRNGLFVEEVGYSSSGTALTLEFTANANTGYWTVLMLDVKTAGATVTFSNITLTKTSEGTGGSGGETPETPDTPSTPVNNLFSSADANFVDGQILRSSGGTKGGTGFVTGYIQAELNDTIYVRNTGGTSYHDQGAPIICLYNASDKSFNTGFYATQTSYVTIDADGLGFSCKIQKSGVGFVRIQGQPTGAYSNFIVTKNEPIV
jgi:hypothetical protein